VVWESAGGFLVEIWEVGVEASGAQLHMANLYTTRMDSAWWFLKGTVRIALPSYSWRAGDI